MSTLVREMRPAVWERILPQSGNNGVSRIGVRLEHLLGQLLRYHAVAKQRHALRLLTDAELKDIGISRVDALREASKPFWR